MSTPTQRELERRIVSVLFCDLAGFTSLSERLDAEDVAIVQNAYFDTVRDAVTRHGGTLEKFIGDAAVAVFGVPSAGEHDAEHAVGCGLAIVGAIEQLASRVGLEDGGVRVRVGIQTGEAVVHPSPAAGEAMVTGDVVNTAARLQAAAPLNSVLLGPDAALAVAHAVALEAAGDLELKGKAESVRAARAVSLLAEPERERAMGSLTAPTIGREAELSRVAAALERCAGGSTERFTVVAPPGTGRSRLLAEVARLAAASGAAVRRARVRPDVLSAFRPLAELVSEALAASALEDAGDIRGALREIHRCSRRFIWGLEYYAAEYQEVEYRGHKELLWKTDFAKLYLETCPGLRLVKQRIYPWLDDPNEDVMFLLEKAAAVV